MEIRGRPEDVNDVYWGLKAKEYCSNEAWPGAERGDERWFPRHQAIDLMRRNPGKYDRIGEWRYGGGEWLKRPAKVK
jgi:hypothetical protein